MAPARRRQQPVAVYEDPQDMADNGRRHRRRANDPPESSGSDAESGPESGAGGGVDDPSPAHGDAANVERLARKLVRYALACEYARTPIRRQGIGEKVLSANPRSFKPVFQEAQIILRDVFGMEMTELPLREKVTLAQKRAAQKQEKVATNSNSWVLTSTLPARFRSSAIVPPPPAPTQEKESAYVALYTFVISLIHLAGGVLTEAKLDRYLRRMNAEQSTPVDRTEKVLQRMIKDGYIVKIKDTSSGEENIEYLVGPRGKVEVDKDATAGLVKQVYGAAWDDGLRERLEHSLALAERPQPAAVTSAAGPSGKRKPPEDRQPGRPRKRQESHEDEDSE